MGQGHREGKAGGHRRIHRIATGPQGRCTHLRGEAILAGHHPPRRPERIEALLSLLQMAKTSAALAELASARLPFISVLTDPTTGGVSASLAMLGDLNVAEPKALIGFAGPRVIEQTVREKLPEGFQRSEFLLEHGVIDLIIDRREMRPRLAEVLRILMQQPARVDAAP